MADSQPLCPNHAETAREHNNNNTTTCDTYAPRCRCSSSSSACCRSLPPPASAAASLSDGAATVCVARPAGQCAVRPRWRSRAQRRERDLARAPRQRRGVLGRVQRHDAARVQAVGVALAALRRRRQVGEGVLPGAAGAAAHRPWETPLMKGGYPEPIVDHAERRSLALDRYKAAREAYEASAA